MTNPNIRKTGTSPNNKASSHHINRNANDDRGAVVVAEEAYEEKRSATSDEEEDDSDATPTPSDAIVDEEEDDVNSCSSFSLQECINEFRARRVRRVSTQSREAPQVASGEKRNLDTVAAAAVAKSSNCLDPTDVDLINQNRSNKEHERKCKPCKNGFCYCFTSDSGDGGGACNAATAARGPHVRHARRNKKISEPIQNSNILLPTPPQPPVTKHTTKSKEKRRQSAPANLKHTQPHEEQKQHFKNEPTTSDASGPDELTAISRLETTSYDAPLVHIIQELRNNCVISEVRVNKHKIQAQQRSRSLNARQHVVSSPSKKSHQFECLDDMSPIEQQYVPTRSNCQHILKKSSPSAPALDKITEKDSMSESCLFSTPLDTSSKSNDTSQRKHKSGGRLLQKRLSGSHIQLKPRNMNEPPPKPPRSSAGFEDKLSVSSLASTTASVREAERILDEFLKRRGHKVASQEREPSKHNKKTPKSSQFKTDANKEAIRREKRKSFPLTPLKEKHNFEKPLPSCPSLSDIECAVRSKGKGNYEKNICQAREKAVKEITFGWKEPKINEMLNYDNNGNRKEFKSQAAQAEPQAIGWQEPQAMGWQVPHKIDLDMVDGNLAANIDSKDTPIKTRLFSARKLKRQNSSQKFIWGEQLRNLSPWTSHKSGAKRDRNLKSNLKSSSRTFLNNSKKKILRLVSPKKDNKERRKFEVCKTPLRSIGIQTSQEDFRSSYEHGGSSTPQSPPGSYHSAVQTSQQNSSTTPTRSQNTVDEVDRQFNFNRTVQSPPKKATTMTRLSQRKLNFPLNCGGNLCANRLSGCDVVDAACSATKTYRSFHSDLDQDITLSKMGYILSNIRAKLEASDNNAVRTFQEIERRELQSEDFDRPDSQRIHAETRVDVHHRQVGRCLEPEYGDPIYSEIEDDSIHITGSPHYDNKTGIQHFATERNPEILYAKVNKTPRTQVASSSIVAPTALGKFLQESFKNMHLNSGFPLQPLPPEPNSCDVSYSIPPSEDMMQSEAGSLDRLGHCQSLNNIRVQEHNSPPKKNRNLSKSDLSLHRSEIFLENLCCSEIITEGIETTQPQQKIDNHKSNQCLNLTLDESDTTESECVSYELPQDVDSESNPAGSQLGLSAIETPHTHNQSTPKKTNKKPAAESPQTYVTKHFFDEQTHNDLTLNTVAPGQDHGPASYFLKRLQNSSSCPTTPRKLPPIPLEQQQNSHAASLNEIYMHKNNSNIHDGIDDEYKNPQRETKSFVSASATHYKRIKNALQKSFRKSKKFVKSESKRLSLSLNLPTPPSSSSEPTSRHDFSQTKRHSSTSTLDLDKLFALEENAPVLEQIAKVVSICRQLPDLEISSEMVEAERLLLVSTLRREGNNNKLLLVKPVRKEQPTKRLFIDAMCLPVKANVNHDLFFNYFYICTFQHGGSMKSTQSIECRNNEAIFSECGIEFDCYDNDQTGDLEIRGNIFMLRLRKVSTLAMEPRKTKVVKLPTALKASPTSSSSSSGESIASRFRLQATFVLNYTDFVPYEYVESESIKSNSICLRAASNCVTTLTPRTKSSNLNAEILLTGRAEIRFPKHTYSGFLNVQDPYNQHNWNRRWCTLDGLQFYVCQDVNDLKEQALLTLDLRKSMQAAPIAATSRELCARPRSFCLQCLVGKAGDDEQTATAAVFFAAETPADLTTWLQHINAVLDFIITWMQ